MHPSVHPRSCLAVRAACQAGLPYDTALHLQHPEQQDHLWSPFSPMPVIPCLPVGLPAANPEPSTLGLPAGLQQQQQPDYEGHSQHPVWSPSVSGQGVGTAQLEGRLCGPSARAAAVPLPLPAGRCPSSSSLGLTSLPLPARKRLLMLFRSPGLLPCFCGPHCFACACAHPPNPRFSPRLLLHLL